MFLPPQPDPAGGEPEPETELEPEPEQFQFQFQFPDLHPGYLLIAQWKMINMPGAVFTQQRLRG